MKSDVTSAKVANPLVELQSLGQSVWLDNISRRILDSGELQKLIEEDGLRGVTSNPTIFEKAINGSHDYDAAIRSFADTGKNVNDIYEALVIDDIQRAADFFRSVFHATKGLDGYVSLEVSPKLANDTQATLTDARLGRRRGISRVDADGGARWFAIRRAMRTRSLSGVRILSSFVFGLVVAASKFGRAATPRGISRIAFSTTARCPCPAGTSRSV